MGRATGCSPAEHPVLRVAVFGRKRPGTRPYTCTGTALLVDGMLYGSGYKKHKSWLCLDWKSGETRYGSKGLTTGAAVYADGRLYCLTEDSRPALLRPTPDRFAIDGQFRLLNERVNNAGRTRSCFTAGVPALPRYVVV